MSFKREIIEVSYDAILMEGQFKREGGLSGSSIWERLKAYTLSRGIIHRSTHTQISLAWSDSLELIREFGTKTRQRSLNFRFEPTEQAKEKIAKFAAEIKAANSSRQDLIVTLTDEEIEQVLVERGFTKRALKPFQMRDLKSLATLPHGANFSVPGAGKTTVTFALHILLRSNNEHLFVVCPKAAFPAWSEVVGDCMADDAPNNGAEPFTRLDGDADNNLRLLQSGSTRFVMSYDLMVRQQSELSGYFARQKVHLILDESHRMKAGWGSRRGAFLLKVAPLPARRDILSGTPMPQDANDIASQLAFLWPGQGLDLRIQRGEAPRSVLGDLYVRTTKTELGLPPRKASYHDVDMAPGQLALYAIVRSEVLRNLYSAIRRNKTTGPDFLSARRSVMRLLQISVNPTLALHGIVGDHIDVDSGIVDTVVEEGTSNKILEVADHARQLGRDGKKTVIWTIFTNNILEMQSQLIEMNPVTIYGGVPSGDSDDLGTREGRLRRFHEDDSCKVLIANPAAAGEGISLHTVCHDGIYLDRSYVSTHYLQSIDRIHRLGLPPDTKTNIHIYRTKAPPSVGSIDLSVSRRLAEKIRNLQKLLDDPDLNDIALDEEEADDPIDYDVEIQDLVDLVNELEGKAPQNVDLE